MKTYAIYNKKGGVAKSTLAVNLSHGLAELGFKTALFDTDGQNHCSLYLGIEKNYKYTLLDLLRENPEEIKLSKYAIKARENLDLFPCGNSDDIETVLRNEFNMNRVLDKKLVNIESEGYEYVIFDCGPALNRINAAVLYYVDEIIVPCKTEIASIDGIDEMYDYLRNTLEIDTNKITIVVPTLYDTRQNVDKEAYSIINEIFKSKGILTQPLYKRAKISEAALNGKTVFEYDQESTIPFLNILERMVPTID